nr:hypothetical protein CFP56_78431 [Quercus suber]
MSLVDVSHENKPWLLTTKSLRQENFFLRCRPSRRNTYMTTSCTLHLAIADHESSCRNAHECHDLGLCNRRAVYTRLREEFAAVFPAGLEGQQCLDCSGKFCQSPICLFSPGQV